MIRRWLNQNSQAIIVLVSICAKSLNVDQTNEKRSYTKNNESIEIAGSKNMAQSSYNKLSLSKVIRVLSLHYNNADKVNCILTNYSMKNNCRIKDIARKYIQKFKYIYHQRFYYQDSIKSNNTKAYFNKIQRIGIIALYIVYKLIRSDNKLYIYAKIMKEANHSLF